MLLLLLIALPLTGAFIIFFTKDKSIKTPFICTLLVLILAVFSLKDIFAGGRLIYSLALPGPFSINFQADSLSSIFVILSAFLWFIVSIYSPKYMKYEGKEWIFQFFTLITLFAVLGVFLAKDLLTMLLFFELMTIASYFWVIHRWDKEAIEAGYFYLFFSIVGGLLLALGIVMMGSATDMIPNIGSGMVSATDPKLFAWSILIFMVGFGIKAGMVPLHLWLPYAHSVAPTPGSALLSGLIIKVGVYGLIRVGEFAGFGQTLGEGVSWLGTTVIVLGTLTMLLGVLAALIQSNAKKLLAYHSISQMGYIILGLGISLYLGSNGSLGLSGSIYHIINHALFKVALFLGVGIIYINTGQTNLYKLGGLWRKFPLTAILMFIAVLGITGAPGLNGYASKSLLHHGISLAVDTGDGWLIWIERLFMVVGVGTAASFAKLFYLTFLGKSTDLKVENKSSPLLQTSMGILALLMLVIGIRPELLLNFAIIPAIESLGIAGGYGALKDINFWAFKDIFQMIITLALGIGVCWAGLKSGAFHLHPPAWLTIEGVAGIFTSKAYGLLKVFSSVFNSLSNKLKRILSRGTLGFINRLKKLDKSKESTLMGVDLKGVSMDILILVIVLAGLIGWYAISKPGLI